MNYRFQKQFLEFADYQESDAKKRTTISLNGFGNWNFLFETVMEEIKFVVIETYQLNFTVESFLKASPRAFGLSRTWGKQQKVIVNRWFLLSTEHFGLGFWWQIRSQSLRRSNLSNIERNREKQNLEFSCLPDLQTREKTNNFSVVWLCGCLHVSICRLVSKWKKSNL